jgi:hypothetical protein
MSRTTRYDNGLNKGRDDSPKDSRCGPDSSHPKGYNTHDDDHGYYGAEGHKFMKRHSSRAARNYWKNFKNKEIEKFYVE